ncbi:hypothetical protein AB0L57_13260 [Nocardia sp. NPDC052254]|uniref:hypothetical protein n=1 Tax=Nocardia sp. NPDC052254 TaxID=3155681 RepID=UPI003427E1DA
MSEPDDFIFDVAKGDQGVSRQLRATLLTIKSATTDPDLRRHIDDALAGKTSMRSFGASETFARIVDGIPPEQVDRTVHMPEGERRRLAEQGERELERLRQTPDAAVTEDGTDRVSTPHAPPRVTRHNIVPGTRKPDREQIFEPDEPDEDDLYFQDRRNNGWLQ